METVDLDATLPYVGGGPDTFSDNSLDPLPTDDLSGGGMGSIRDPQPGREVPELVVNTDYNREAPTDTDDEMLAPPLEYLEQSETSPATVAHSRSGRQINRPSRFLE